MSPGPYGFAGNSLIYWLVNHQELANGLIRPFGFGKFGLPRAMRQMSIKLPLQAIAGNAF